VTIQHPCTALFESIGRDEEAYGELLDVFLEDAPPRVDAIQSAIHDGDIGTLAREAHTYKGAAAVLEATEVRQCADALELLARRGCLDGAADIANRLAAESAALFEIIRRYRSAFLHAA
jgi:HPt (histidine-containing phosphotransfer) domain-containing protein